MRICVLILSLFLVMGMTFASIGIGGGIVVSFTATPTQFLQGNILLGIGDVIALDLQAMQFTQFATDAYLIDPYLELTLPLGDTLQAYGGVAPIFGFTLNDQKFEFEDLYFVKVGIRLILLSPLMVYGEAQWLANIDEEGIGVSDKYLLGAGAQLFFK